jgi:hypothetical protein
MQTRAVSIYAAANQMQLYNLLQPSPCQPHLASCFDIAKPSYAVSTMDRGLESVIHNAGLESGQERMLPNASLVKTKKPRLGARGVSKVKTGCQTCKYVF